jgi:hypothetical protein
MIWNDVTNAGTLNFMNPWNGVTGSTNIRLSSGKIYTDYGGTNGSWISEINAVSAVPEPGSLVIMVGIALMSLPYFWWRNANKL